MRRTEASVGERRHGEQGLAIRPALTFAEPPLMREERRAAHEEHRKRRQPDVNHGVLTVAMRAQAPVRKSGAGFAQRLDQGLQRTHALIGSETAPRRQAKSPLTDAEMTKSRQPCPIGPGGPTPAVPEREPLAFRTAGSRRAKAIKEDGKQEALYRQASRGANDSIMIWIA
jgi:hypothetical protein